MVIDGCRIVWYVYNWIVEGGVDGYPEKILEKNFQKNLLTTRFPSNYF
jgi:hypothetical protein